MVVSQRLIARSSLQGMRSTSGPEEPHWSLPGSLIPSRLLPHPGRVARLAQASGVGGTLETRMSQRLGQCHICGEVGPLTFEHVPPRGAFNRYAVVRSTLMA